MTITMVDHVQESRKSTNIYLNPDVAEHLAAELLVVARVVRHSRMPRKFVRIVILNKTAKPDIQVHPYEAKTTRTRKKK